MGYLIYEGKGIQGNTSTASEMLTLELHIYYYRTYFTQFQPAEHQYKQKRIRLQNSKKFNCPAQVIFKEIVQFPDFKISASFTFFTEIFCESRIFHKHGRAYSPRKIPWILCCTAVTSKNLWGGGGSRYMYTHYFQIHFYKETSLKQR